MQGACLCETSFFKNYLKTYICPKLLSDFAFKYRIYQSEKIYPPSPPPKKKGSCNELGGAI